MAIACQLSKDEWVVLVGVACSVCPRVVGGWWLVFGREGKQRSVAMTSDGNSIQIGVEELQRCKSLVWGKKG